MTEATLFEDPGGEKHSLISQASALISGQTDLIANAANSGHIVCDADSRSEIVVPLFEKNGELIGVLDVDSPLPGRFDAADEAMLVEIAKIFMRSIR